jgi:hypothetical protein
MQFGEHGPVDQGAYNMYYKPSVSVQHRLSTTYAANQFGEHRPVDQGACNMYYKPSVSVQHWLSTTCATNHLYVFSVHSLALLVQKA